MPIIFFSRRFCPVSGCTIHFSCGDATIHDVPRSLNSGILSSRYGGIYITLTASPWVLLPETGVIVCFI